MMGAIINAIKDSPIPLLIITAGIIFFFLGVSGFTEQIVIQKKRIRKGFIVIGMTLLALGLVIYFIPNESKTTYRLVMALDRPEIHGKQVKVNGLVTRTDIKPMIGKLEWSWGDGQTESHWFPAYHEFSDSGQFKIIVRAIDINDIVAMDSLTVYIE